MNDTIDAVDALAWQPHVEYLHKYFYDHADARCLLWVNPAQADLFEGDPLVQERRVQVPIRHARFDVTLGPYLVQLDLSRSADSDVLRTSVESAWNAWDRLQLLACKGQPIAGWVETSGQPKALALHWARHCHLHRHSGLSKLLRFHDPSVREWLWPILTPAQRGAMLGPATSLFAIGRGKVLTHHAAAEIGIPDQCDSGEAERFSYLSLENYQWDQVEEYATVHAAWVAWAAAQADEAGKPTAKGWEQSIFSALLHASSYGIHDAHDRELFALHALQLNCDFHASPRMRPVWEKTLAGDYYGSAVEEVFERPANQLHAYLCAA